MTDRHAGYVVVLKEDLREDDAQALIDALKMLKGVLTVEPIISGPDIIISTHRAKAEIERKLWKVLHEEAS